MIRSRFKTPNRFSQTRWGYTLFEVLLALGLSSLLMLLVYGAMESFWRLSTLGRLDAERCQLARTLIRRMEMDIRSLTYKPAEEAPRQPLRKRRPPMKGPATPRPVRARSPRPKPPSTQVQEDDTYLVSGRASDRDFAILGDDRAPAVPQPHGQPAG